MTHHLKIKYNDNFKIFWVAEPASYKNDYHVHALIKIDESELQIKDSLTQAWHAVSPPSGYRQHNLLDVQKYEPSKGGRYYIAKHIQKDNIDYDIG